MTIHDEHPFLDPEPDPVRRFRGRLGGAVTLWTSYGGRGPVGLTVSSVVVAGGDPARVLGLLDPDSDLAEALEPGSRLLVHLLEWRHRDLAEAFAGQLPAPGGAFAAADFVETDAGPRLADATSWVVAEVEELSEVGWSVLVQARVVDAVVGEEQEPLEHRRGRYQRPAH